MRIIVLIFMILILSGLFVISNNNLYMYEQESRDIFVELYFDWVSQLSFNSEFLTGDVNLNWSPE
jgi:hypothetical protein